MKTPAPSVLTMGEPAGIGGELTLRAWSEHRQRLHPFFTLDDPDLALWPQPHDIDPEARGRHKLFYRHEVVAI